MTERKQLLQEIRDHPQDHTVRLAYADWLDENGEGDLDAATAEFIRSSCVGPGVGKTRMATAAYGWLGKNWQRLVPSLLALHRPFVVATLRDGTNVYCKDDCGPHEQRGRAIWTRLGLRSGTTGTVYGCSCLLTFWKGFLGVFQCYSNFTREAAVGPVLRDQPLCVYADPDVWVTGILLHGPSYPHQPLPIRDS